MIDLLKEKFLENPEFIKEYLEYYDYCNIRIRNNYISFGRDLDSSPKSIVIRLKDNEALLVHDYARNLIRDIFGFVIIQRHETFKNVINTAKKIVGIKGYINKEENYQLFGGFYKSIKNKKDYENQIYDSSILENYEKHSNKRFLKDGISIETQRFYQIGYDIEHQVITIPIWNEVGDLIGVKARINRDPGEDERKYYYLVNCFMSETLYGYHQNYSYLQEGKIFIFESEKSVMQLHSMGIYNAVALGSSSLSKKQAQLLLALNPEEIFLMFDEGLEDEVIERNIRVLKTFGKMKEFKIRVWKPSKDIPSKSSPSDLGKEKFEEIVKEECELYE